MKNQRFICITFLILSFVMFFISLGCINLLNVISLNTEYDYILLLSKITFNGSILALVLFLIFFGVIIAINLLEFFNTKYKGE